jgi:prevent-host-death family protein
MRTVTATEAKAKLLALLDEVEKGAAIEITRRGVAIARLAPARRPRGIVGLFEGQGWSSPKDEDLYSTGETWNAM